MMHHNSNILLGLLYLGLLSGFGPTAHAQLFVYEGFEYETAAATRAGADLLQGQADDPLNSDLAAFGLGSTWNDIAGAGQTSDLFLATDSLSFGDLASSGNHVRSDTNQNNDNFGRPITTNIGGGSGLWFSFLANKLQNNFSAAEGGLVIGNQQVNTSRIKSIGDTSGQDSNNERPVAGLQGFGIAPTTSGNNWTPYAWDGSSAFVGDAALGVPTNGSETNLLVGHVSFDSGTNGADVFTAYSYSLNGGSVVGGSLDAIASPIEFAMDQTQLDTLSLTRQVNVAYDEIRVGATLDDVVFKGGPPPVLTLQVNTNTGNVALALTQGEQLGINSYQILSDGDSLDPSGWLSLADQGSGWVEAGGSSAGALAENLLSGNTTILSGSDISLGSAFNTSIDSRDLSFTYRTDLGRIIEGSVEYISTGTIQGDFNGDGQVDLADYTLWRNNLGEPDSTLAAGSADNSSSTVDGGDYALWRTSYGNGVGGTNAKNSAVPEPSTTMLLACFAGFALLGSRLR